MVEDDLTHYMEATSRMRERAEKAEDELAALRARLAEAEAREQALRTALGESIAREMILREAAREGIEAAGHSDPYYCGCTLCSALAAAQPATAEPARPDAGGEGQG